MKTKILTIDEEYNKLIPPTEHVCIFGDWNDYNTLQKNIINHPKIHFQKHKLPFQDISFDNNNEVHQLKKDENPQMRCKSNESISKEVCAKLSTIIFALKNYQGSSPFEG